MKFEIELSIEYRTIHFSKIIFLILKLIDNFKRLKSKNNFGQRKKKFGLLNFIILPIKFPYYFSFFFFFEIRSDFLHERQEIEVDRKWIRTNRRKRSDKSLNVTFESWVFRETDYSTWSHHHPREIRNFRIISIDFELLNKSDNNLIK